MSIPALLRPLCDGRPFFAARSARQRTARCLPAALAFALVATALMVLNNEGKGPDDDLGIAVALSTLYPGAGQCPFTNALLNAFISSLNSLMPILNWTLVVERLSSAAALFALAYGLVRWCPRGFACALLGFVLVLLYPLCTVSANFTAVAGLCVFAGEALFLLGVVKRRTPTLAVGAVLIVVGFMWRANMLLLSAPFFALALAVLIAKAYRDDRDRLASLVKRLACGAAALVIAVGALAGYHQAQWSTPELGAWLDYSNARSQLCDYPTKPYEDIADELAALDVSKNDYWCMTHWITADPAYFTTERLRAVADIATVSKHTSPLDAAADELAALAMRHPELLLLLVGVALVAGLARGRRVIAVAVLSFAVTFTACVYFRMAGRFPLRVEYPLWLMSLLPLIPLLAAPPAAAPETDDGTQPQPGPDRLSRRTGLGIAIGALCAVAVAVQFAPSFAVHRIDQFQAESAFAKEQSLVQRFSQNDALYVWDPSAYSAVERQLKYRFLPPASFMDHNILAGGWTQGSSFIAANNERLGAANPLRSLIDRPHTYFVAKRPGVAKHVLRYLKEHYATDIAKKTVEVIDVNPKVRLTVIEFRDKGKRPTR